MSSNPWLIQSQINQATYTARFWDNPVYIPPEHTQYTFDYNTTMSLQDGVVINNHQPVPRLVTPDITGARFYNQITHQTVRVVRRSAYAARGDDWECELVTDPPGNFGLSQVNLTERALYSEWIKE